MTDAGKPNLSTVSDRNLYTALDRVFERASDRAAFIAPDGELILRYGELRDRAARYANALAILGVAAGDRVTVQTEKSLSGIMLYLATLKAANTSCSTNSTVTPDLRISASTVRS